MSSARAKRRIRPLCPLCLCGELTVDREPSHDDRFALRESLDRRNILEATRQLQSALRALANVSLEIRRLEVGEALACIHYQGSVLGHCGGADHFLRRDRRAMNLDGLHALPSRQLWQLA